jgi:hypothetical protein
MLIEVEDVTPVLKSSTYNGGTSMSLGPFASSHSSLASCKIRRWAPYHITQRRAQWPLAKHCLSAAQPTARAIAHGIPWG